MAKTLKQVIDFVQEIKPSAFSEAVLTEWISEVEARVQTEVLLMAPAEMLSYDWEQDQNTELLVASPYDALYRHWLEAQIDYANGEYSKYANSAEMFNSVFEKLTCWFAQNYRPADTHEEVNEDGN